MKKDGRTHDRKTKETLRMIAVARIRDGEDVAAVMTAWGYVAPRRTNGWARLLVGVEGCTV